MDIWNPLEVYSGLGLLRLLAVYRRVELYKISGASLYNQGEQYVPSIHEISFLFLAHPLAIRFRSVLLSILWTLNDTHSYPLKRIWSAISPFCIPFIPFPVSHRIVSQSVHLFARSWLPCFSTISLIPACFVCAEFPTWTHTYSSHVCHFLFQLSEVGTRPLT